MDKLLLFLIVICCFVNATELAVTTDKDSLVNIRKSPSVNSPIVTTVPVGTIIYVNENEIVIKQTAKYGSA